MTNQNRVATDPHRGDAMATTTASPSDAQLLARFVERRDEVAFQTLVRRHGPLVFGVCRRVLRHRQDAEDAFQAAFLVLARKAHSLGKREALASWLFGVARRTAQKAHAASRRRKAQEMAMTDVPEPAAPPASTWPDIEPVLDEELARLPEPLRAAVLLCDFEGNGQLEAARRLGWPRGTLSVRLLRGRALLAQRLTRRGIVVTSGAAVLLIGGNAASAVPAPLVAATVKAAGLFAASHAAPAGLIGSQAAAIAKGTLQTMFVAKLKIVAAVAALVLIGAVGAGEILLPMLAAESATGAKAGGPSGLRERFLAEAPAAWGELEAATANLEYTVDLVVGRPGKGPTDADVATQHFVHMTATIEKAFKPGSGLEHARQVRGGRRGENVRGWNPRYSFDLGRYETVDAWKESRISPPLPEKLQQAQVRDSYSVASIGALSLGEIFKAPSCKVKKVASQGPLAVVDFTCDYSPNPAASKYRILGGSITLDPDRQWALRKYKLNSKFDNRAETREGTIDYQSPPASGEKFPLIERKVENSSIPTDPRNANSPREPLRHIETYKNVKECQKSDDDFSLSAFGLPEPAKVPGK